MQKIIRVFLTLCMLMGGVYQTLAVPAASSAEVNRVVMATGAVTSGYFLLGGGICAQLNAASGPGGLHCAVETSMGTVANLQALKAGQINLALVQSDWQQHAFMGTVTQFAGDKAVKDMRALMSLTGSPLIVLARSDGNIKQVADLAGTRMDIGKPGTGRRAAMNDMLAALGWDLGKFKLASELPEAEAIKSLCGGKLDALALVGITPDRNVSLALRTCSLKLIPITGPVVKKLLTDKPYYSVVTIPKGGYQGVAADVPSIGLRVILVASGRVTEKDAYAIVKAATSRLDAVRKLHPSFVSIDPKGVATAGISVPLHSGAEKFYREAQLK